MGVSSRSGMLRDQWDKLGQQGGNDRFEKLCSCLGLSSLWLGLERFGPSGGVYLFRIGFLGILSSGFIGSTRG